MPTTTAYRFGDIVLVPFPFTDQSGIKHRPAVIVSSDAYHRERDDCLMMAVTSQIRSSGSMETDITGWRHAGLIKPSVVKSVVFTIESSLIRRRLGRLNGHDCAALRRMIPSMFDLSGGPIS